ncbi:MAG TPA: hypothetical protein ENI27_09185 [bacterium]|nr:hypothetical protein [bacterium]
MNVPILHRSNDGLVLSSEILQTYMEWNSIHGDGFKMVPHFRVNIDKLIAYVVIPKNAHQAVSFSIMPFWIIDRYEENAKRLLNNYTVFTVVRNPITRFVSAYLMVNNAMGYPPGGLGGVVRAFPYWKIDNPVERFAQYIRDVFRHGLYEPHLMTQNYYLNVDVKIDRYLMFERLSTEAPRLLGVEFRKTNPTKHPELNRTLRKFLLDNKEYFDMLVKLYSDDFAMYHEKTGVDILNGESVDEDWTFEEKAEYHRLRGC